MHTRNILEDPRCTLVVQMPGWQGLSNARVTIFGEIYRLPQNMQAAAREVSSPSPSHPPTVTKIGSMETCQCPHKPSSFSRQPGSLAAPFAALRFADL